MRSATIVAGLASLAATLGGAQAWASAPLPLGGQITPSTVGPALPATGLDASHCGTQVPDSAIVHTDGSITDAAGHALAGNVVCSYADVASNATGHGTTTNTTTTTSLETQALIQPTGRYMVDEFFVDANTTGSWYSLAMTIRVPADPTPNVVAAPVRFFSGLLGAGQDQTVIAGTLQYYAGQFAAYAMLESAASSNDDVYSRALNPVYPGDTIVVTVANTSFLMWTATVTDQTTGASQSLTVQYDPLMVYAVPAVMDAQGIATCAGLPNFPSVHFGSPLLYEEDGAGSRVAAPDAFVPGFFDASSGDLVPKCGYSNWAQNDNGNRTGYADLTWNCTPSFSCPAGSCGNVPVRCTTDTFNCGGCGAGQVCSSTNMCVAACVPKTCATFGATCGTIPDECGGTLTCGPACPVPPKPVPGLPRKGAAGLAALLFGVGVVMVGRSKRSRSSEVSR